MIRALLLLAAALLLGCAPRPSSPLTAGSSSSITTALADKAHHTQDQRDSIISIQAHNAEVRAAFPLIRKDLRDGSKALSPLYPATNSIAQEAEAALKAIANGEREDAHIVEAVKDFARLESRNRELESADEQNKAAAQNAARGWFTLITVAGVLIGVGGVVAGFFLNWKLGVSIIVIGVAAFLFGATAQEHMKDISDIGYYAFIGLLLVGVPIGLWTALSTPKRAYTPKEVAALSFRLSIMPGQCGDQVRKWVAMEPVALLTYNNGLADSKSAKEAKEKVDSAPSKSPHQQSNRGTCR